MKEIFATDLRHELARHAENTGDQIAKIACFDADHTLWMGDLGDLAYQRGITERLFKPEAEAPLRTFLEKTGEASSGDPHQDARALYIAYKQGKVSEVDIVSAMVVCFAGWRLDDLVEFGREIMVQTLHDFVYEDTLILLEAARNAGLKVHVVSGTAEALVRGAAQSLGIPAEQIRSARPCVVDGIIGAEMDSPITYREGKGEALSLWVGERRIVAAFGDSLGDEFLFARAELKVGVNPRPGLRKHAQSQGGSGWYALYPSRTKSGLPVERIETDRVIV